MPKNQSARSPKTQQQRQREAAQFIADKIKEFVHTSPLNKATVMDNNPFFDEPLVQFADGDDPIFTEYKTIIDPSHLTPREALAKALDQRPEDMTAGISVISWILPITSQTRESNYPQTTGPSRRWAYTRWYGEQFNEAVRKYTVALVTEMGHLAAAPLLQPYFKVVREGQGAPFSNWSERHVAYAAGLGTFSLSDGFITERGIAQRCGSVVTNLTLPPSPRTAQNHYANCLFYVNGKCRACIKRCPAGAVTEKGHDKLRCQQHLDDGLRDLQEEYGIKIIGCGLCQTKVPCEYRNPTKRLSRQTAP